MAIVKEIVDSIKPIIQSHTGYTQLPYEYDISLNRDDAYDERFGFVPSTADFIEGRAMGFTSMDHLFQLILCKSFRNDDCDEASNAVIMDLYTKAQDLLKTLQKSKVSLPTPMNRISLIRGVGFEEPELISENTVVALRLNFIIQYSYRNN